MPREIKENIKGKTIKWQDDAKRTTRDYQFNAKKNNKRILKEHQENVKIRARV